MPGISLIIDPVAEAAANVPLSLNDGVHFRAMKATYPTPPRNVQWASNSDTEGAERGNLQYGNRTITIECRVVGTSAADLQTQLGYLEQKVGKINDTERGTHEYVSPSGAVCVFDLLEAAADYELDNSALANWRTTVTITFTAKPFWRAGLAHEVAGTDHVETTKPVVIGVDTAIGGEVSAIGRLVIDEDQGQDQWTLIWGLQCESYDSSVDAELFYEAESRMPQGGAELKALAGSSGTGSNAVFQGGLLTTYMSMLSTQKAGGGNHLRNVGSFRVYGRFYRPTTNTGQVSIALEYAQGDFRHPEQLSPKTWAPDEREGVFTIVDLGLVHLDPVSAGTQRWEGRIIAKSSVMGDDIYCDWLFFRPVGEGSGVIKVEPTSSTPTVITGHDEFEQTEGSLSGKSLPVGGTWSGAGDAVDFKVISASHTLQRSEISDANINTGRYAIAGTQQPSSVQVVAAIACSSLLNAEETYRLGVFARYTNAENWVMAYVTSSPTGWEFPGPFVACLRVAKRVGGTVTILDSMDFTGAGSALSTVPITLAVSANGSWQAILGSPYTATINGHDSALATEGVLEKGKVGIYDASTLTATRLRTYDNFAYFEGPPADAAVFGGRSAEVASDRFQRQDSTGSLWVPRGDYGGDYFRMPPSRREGRQVRTIVKLSRGNIDYMADSAIDDASFRIYWQARGLGLPES